MTTVPRHCLFCGREGTSREHIFARWIGRSLAGQPVPGITVQFVHESFTAEGVPRKPKTALTTAYYTRAFCRANCNNGWMADLEEVTKPVLEPMLHGRPRTTVSVHDQRILAFWATKTAFAFQTQEGAETTWARPDDFEALYREQGPLPRSQVWLGAREVGTAGWYRAHSVLLPGSNDVVDGFGLILTVGFAVFWILVPYRERVTLRLFGQAALAMKPIWPGLGRSMAWPPPYAIGRTNLTGLPEHLIRNSRLLVPGS